jgi:hypothetical protein
MGDVQPQNANDYLYDGASTSRETFYNGGKIPEWQEIISPSPVLLQVQKDYFQVEKN